MQLARPPGWPIRLASSVSGSGRRDVLFSLLCCRRLALDPRLPGQAEELDGLLDAPRKDRVVADLHVELGEGVVFVAERLERCRPPADGEPLQLVQHVRDKARDQRVCGRGFEGLDVVEDGAGELAL